MGVRSRTSAQTPALDQTLDIQIILGKVRPPAPPRRGSSTRSDHCSRPSAPEVLEACDSGRPPPQVGRMRRLRSAGVVKQGQLPPTASARVKLPLTFTPLWSKAGKPRPIPSVVIADAEGLLNNAKIWLVRWLATYLLGHLHALIFRRGQELTQAGLRLRQCAESCCPG